MKKGFGNIDQVGLTAGVPDLFIDRDNIARILAEHDNWCCATYNDDDDYFKEWHAFYGCGLTRCEVNPKIQA